MENFSRTYGIFYILLSLLVLISTGCEPEETLRIVAFGDSITATRSSVDSVFAQRLPSLLQQQGYNVEVINRGVGGSHSGRLVDNNRHKKAHALDRFDSAVLSSDPDLTIMGFGMNDCWVDSDSSSDPSRISKEVFRRNMTFMIDSLRSIDSRVILIAPNPLGTRYVEWRNERLLEYVEIVLSIAEEYGIGLVNNYEIFKKYAAEDGQAMDDLLLDGLHPNDEGHKLIADALAKEIKETMPD